jgi:hypothetical protein
VYRRDETLISVAFASCIFSSSTWTPTVGGHCPRYFRHIFISRHHYGTSCKELVVIAVRERELEQLVDSHL